MWTQLVDDAEQLLDVTESLSIRFSIIDIVLITFFFIYNAIMIYKMAKIGASIKKTLRYFPDSILLKDKHIMMHISSTSSSGYSSMFKRYM